MAWTVTVAKPAQKQTARFQHTNALALSRAVRQVEALVDSGERRASALIAAAEEIFAAELSIRVEYIEVVDWETLGPVETAASGTLFAIAAWVGATRLIDNTIIA